ncbi:hypothetical protein [Helicobacter ibis]|uniref:Uncharacterized protein n=1 Tax=Helicobacter ibis TaxID=2962633 RepID=A0ABT4VET1_9HELI|nr:hypothetical protein [Helicobacter ibis]MDA3969217.1 hypothetical protein [Helicobacter ibis]
MKKLILSIFILSSITSNIYANDLISIATNGIYNKDSIGVRELNDEEMSKVVGGLQFYDRFYVQGSAIYTNYYIVNPYDLRPYPVSDFSNELLNILQPNEVLGYAQRFNLGREECWLVGIDTSRKSIREIPFSASTRLYKVINGRYSSKYGY